MEIVICAVVVVLAAWFVEGGHRQLLRFLERRRASRERELRTLSRTYRAAL